MSLHEVEGSPADPWEQPLQGSLERLMVRSQLLEGNPLGDPAVRPRYVYRPAAADGETGNRLPSVYLLQGFGGELEECDEVIPFVDGRYPTLGERGHRGVCGKSSGGYGAMVIPMLRPDVFGALASHAGDALFQCCYQPFFPMAARLLRDHFEGSWERFDARMRTAGFDWRQCGPPVRGRWDGVRLQSRPRPGWEAADPVQRGGVSDRRNLVALVGVGSRPDDRQLSASVIC